MVSREDRISEAMKERIIQLEKELNQCRNHLMESIQRGEALEYDMEALQNEAHGVVAQWAEKAAELQSKLDGLLSSDEKMKCDLLFQEKKTEELQCCLQDSEAKNISLNEESKRLKEAYKELAEKLAVGEESLSSASQRIVEYEKLQNEMESEMKQRAEEIKLLVEEKSDLSQKNLELQEEKRQMEAAYLDTGKLTGILKSELASCQREVLLCTGVMMLSEEEYRTRDEIKNSCVTCYVDCIMNEIKHQLHSNLALEAKNRMLEQVYDSLQSQKKFLEAELQSTRDDLSSVRQRHEKTTEELRQHVRLLEGDICELQDADINLKKVLESLKKELDAALIQCYHLESAKEDMETEFRAVKDCYSTLLLEHNELKVFKQKQEDEMSAKVAFWTNECDVIRNGYESHLQNLLMEKEALQQVVSSTEWEAMERLENIERISLVVSWDGILMHLISAHCTKLVDELRKAHKQLSDTKGELITAEDLLRQKVVENRALEENLNVLEKSLFLSRNEIASLESKVLQFTSELETSQKSYDEIKNDNNWLVEEVESMRQELGEINSMLKASLDDRMEEKENHELLHEKLLCEIRQHEVLLQQSQVEIDLLNERCLTLTSENGAISKTLLLTEKELENTKRECCAIHQREEVLVQQKRDLESNVSRLLKEHTEVEKQIFFLKEQMQTQDIKLQLVSASGRRELETTKVKLNSFIEKYEDAEQRLAHVTKCLQESESSASTSRESYQKARVALEEAKQRCCSDMETIQKLLSERQSLLKDRDSVVEKYNRVHDMLKAVKKEGFGKLTDELQKLTDLCSKQEFELQQLRHQNIAIKRCIMSLPDVGGAQIERQKFVKPLNVTEGPLRRPKKRVEVSLDTK